MLSRLGKTTNLRNVEQAFGTMVLHTRTNFPMDENLGENWRVKDG
jgi:hypothetical protein